MIELDYRQLKGELGLDHYEGRSYLVTVGPFDDQPFLLGVAAVTIDCVGRDHAEHREQRRSGGVRAKVVGGRGA